MDLTTIVATASLALTGQAHGTATILPSQQFQIALRVAGPGRPNCIRHRPDGTSGPCLPRFAMQPGRSINGWSGSGTITFSAGAVSRLDADSFALLAGHEIAHWYLGHAESTPATELAADRLGATLACRAGYDVARGLALLRYLRRGRDHPDRIARITAARQGQCEISAPARAPDSSR